MTQDEENDIYKKAIDKWGATAQMEMVVEECSELIKAIQKFKRADQNDKEDFSIQNIQEEIADVQIMLNQMNFLFSREDIYAHKCLKLMRLRERLEK